MNTQAQQILHNVPEFAEFRPMHITVPEFIDYAFDYVGEYSTCDHDLPGLREALEKHLGDVNSRPVLDYGPVSGWYEGHVLEEGVFDYVCSALDVSFQWAIYRSKTHVVVLILWSDGGSFGAYTGKFEISQK